MQFSLHKLDYNQPTTGKITLLGGENKKFSELSVFCNFRSDPRVKLTLFPFSCLHSHRPLKIHPFWHSISVSLSLLIFSFQPSTLLSMWPLVCLPAKVLLRYAKVLRATVHATQ